MCPPTVVGGYSGSVLGRYAAGQAADLRVPVAVVEVRGGAAPDDPPRAVGGRQYPVHRRQPAAVGPTGQQVTEVDQQAAGLRQDVVPLAVGVEDLQPPHAVGPQHGDDAVIGVRAHPHLVAVDDGLAVGDQVVDHAQHVDGVVGERSEVALLEPQRPREDPGQPPGESTGLGTPLLHRLAEARHGRPDIGRVQRFGQIQAGEGGRFGADVEGLEEVLGGRGHTQAEAELLGARRGVAAVDVGGRRTQLPLLLRGKREERVQRVGEGPRRGLGDAVPTKLQEADGARRPVDRRRDGRAVVVATGVPVGDVDDGYLQYAVDGGGPARGPAHRGTSLPHRVRRCGARLGACGSPLC